LPHIFDKLIRTKELKIEPYINNYKNRNNKQNLAQQDGAMLHWSYAHIKDQIISKSVIFKTHIKLLIIDKLRIHDPTSTSSHKTSQNRLGATPDSNFNTPT